ARRFGTEVEQPFLFRTRSPLRVAKGRQRHFIPSEHTR
ncbi:hypothetical protein NGA_0111102, partial [Nannochloropsis gaditana CCMP526]